MFSAIFPSTTYFFLLERILRISGGAGRTAGVEVAIVAEGSTVAALLVLNRFLSDDLSGGISALSRLDPGVLKARDGDAAMGRLDFFP